MVKIAVIGSVAIDLVVTAPKRPNAGETIIGETFRTFQGGKGANQAVAASRLGAEVTMVACVGDDEFGKDIMNNFEKNKVKTHYVQEVRGTASGIAQITLAEGDNSIIVVKGANDCVTPSYVEQVANALKEADIVVIQQEIPEETVEFVCDLCEQYGVPLILNPAPARALSQNVIEKVTYMTPNEHEAEILFGTSDIHQALKRYPNKVFITEGKNGVRYYNGEEEVLVPSYEVDAVDTTGAGDTFNGALAVALAEGKSMTDSIRFANRAASLSVTKFGAQGGMPTRETVEEEM